MARRTPREEYGRLEEGGWVYRISGEYLGDVFAVLLCFFMTVFLSATTCTTLRGCEGLGRLICIRRLRVA
jgi:hypothetical protein